MKPWFRFLLGSALACLWAGTAQAAASISVSNVTVDPSSAKPGDNVTLTVAVVNNGALAGAATAIPPGDDFPAGGFATANVTFTHLSTGTSFSRTLTVTASAVIPGGNGTGNLIGTFTVPMSTSQAGSYRASLSLSGLSSGSLGSGSFSVASGLLAVVGKPDLAITGLTYQAGTAYKGGDVVPMTLTFVNRTATNSVTNVPYVPSLNGDALYSRLEVILSTNPTFGDSDDFLLTSFDLTAAFLSTVTGNGGNGFLNADGLDRTLTWNQILPGNFAGTYYVMAKIDTLSGVSEVVDNDLSLNGNNTWFSPDTNGARISLLPTNFPTVYWASRSGNGYSDNPSVSADGRYTAFASDSTNLVSGDSNGVRDIFLYDNQAVTVRRLSLSQQGTQGNAGSQTPAISGDGRYVAFSSDATNLILTDTNGFSDIFVVDTITGAISLESVGPAGVLANGSNYKPSLSHDGRYLVWESSATNLVAGGTTFGVTHVYRRDRTTGTTVLVSQSTAGTAGSGTSLQATVSADGQYVAFASDATNLVAGDVNGVRDIFLRDVTAGTTIRVSVATAGTEGNGPSRAPAINRNPGVSSGAAADGRYITFGSEATNLVAGDTNAVSDIFVYDRVATTTTRVSVSSAGAQATDPSAATGRLGSINPSISATGRYVVFASLANNLTSGDIGGQQSATDANGALDVFVMDRDVSGSGTLDTPGNIATTLASVNRFGYQTSTLLGTPSSAASDIYPAISADGRWVALPSDAENTAGLVHGATNRTSPDSNTFRDVFLYDRRTNSLPGAGTPPSVAITTPGNGTTAVVNSSTTVTASATASVGVIASVQFYVNGTSLGTSTVFPYSASWIPTAVGTYTLSALATDSFGNQAVSTSIQVTINAAPSVGVTSPVGGAKITVNTPQTITASASATTPGATISSVQFFANGASLGTDTTAPYAASWTPTSNGTYSLTAVATDSLGTTSTSPVVSVIVNNGPVTPPTVSVATPLAGATLPVNTAATVTATAAATNSTISGVQFLANGLPIGTAATFPFSITWTPTVPGTYAVTAAATDSNGSSATSAAISVTVSAGSSPTVALAAPSAGTAVKVGSTETLIANAAAGTGTLARVEFYGNGVLIGVGTSYPYNVAWTPSGPGAVDLTAVAVNSLGVRTASSPVAVSVVATSPTFPSVILTAPSAGASLPIGSGTTLTAVAGDSDGTIASVQFFANGLSLGTDNAFPYNATFTPTAAGTYVLTARATDNGGNQTTSAALTISVSASTGPSVAVTAPSAGTTVAVNSPQELTASAMALAASGTITSVQFYVNGAVQGGTDLVFPYGTTWTPTTPGSYAIMARATDSLGNVTDSAPVVVVAAASASPTVSIVSPAGGAIGAVNTPLVLTASASDSDGTIQGVQFYVNGAVQGVLDTTFPYNASFTPASPGTYVLSAKATDNTGNTTMSAPVTVTIAAGGAPTVTLSAPANGATITAGQTENLIANAAAVAGTLTSVEFYANGVLIGTDLTYPYNVAWTPSGPGSVELTAVAVNSQGVRTMSAPITVAVAATSATSPTVALTTPLAGSALLPGVGVLVNASASDSDGTISSVQFFANGILLGTDTAFPYGVTFTPTASGTYVLTARATDDGGNSTTSSPVSVTVAAPGAPSVAVTGPAAGAAITVNTPQTIAASATAATGTISSVQFYVNGVSVGLSAAFPYSVSWTPASLGSYSLTARATDSAGNVSDSAPLTVNVLASALPVVVITSPATGTSLNVNGSYTLSAGANDPDGTVASVQFLVNGVPQGAPDITFPFSTSFSPTLPGVYVLTARATDNTGNAVTSAPVVVTVTTGTPPTVVVNAPAAGSFLPVNTPATLSATATGNGATIRGVQFFANGTSIATVATFPFTTTWTPPVPGNYALTATATDSNGNATTSDPVVVGVIAGAAPTVTLAAPASGATIGVGTTSTLIASASAGSGALTKVEFFANGTLLGTDLAFPYNFAWTPTMPGTVVLTAVATNSLGNRTTSQPVAVTVAETSPLAPQVAVSAPSAGASLSVGKPTTFSAVATDPDGTVAAVQFLVNGVPLGAADTTFPYATTFTPGSPGSYVLTAQAIDNAGNVTTGAPVNVSVAAASAPSAAVTGPTGGSQVLVNTPVTVTAEATSSSSVIASVQFLVNGDVQGAPDSTFPYSISWTPSAVGAYALAVRATDAAGNISDSAAVTVTVATSGPPTVAVTTPSAGSSFVVGTPLVLGAAAADPDGTVTGVQFFVNGVSLGAPDTVSPYTASWTPGSVGTYAVTAQATDNTGNVTTSALVSLTIAPNAPPAVALTGPVSGTSVGAGTPLSLAATATDADGTVASVRFLANGSPVASVTTAPFLTTWTPSAAGLYSLVAQATDNSGNVTTSTALTVRVNANEVPVVALTAPLRGASLRVAAGTRLTATASDPDGTIASVQFFANGTAVGAPVVAPPYAATWTPASEGIYRLTALAVDNAGASTTSAVSTVLVVAAGASDAIYSGSYFGGTETGRFALVSVRGKSAAFIAFSTAGTSRTYYLPGLTVDAAGGFSALDASGRSLITGGTSDTGVSGTFDNGRLTFIGPVSLSSGSSVVPSGYYTGNLSGRAASAVAAVVAPDGGITAYVTDGASFRDAGSGSVTASGAFSILMSGGSRLVGSLDASSGFLSATLSGGPGGSVLAASGSGVSFSDGFLRNLSTRGQVGTGGDILIAGFVVAGATPKRVLVRAIGPSLAPFGVAGALADPKLDLFAGSARVAGNDNWAGDEAVALAAAEAGAFPLAASSADAAVVLTLAPGAYSAQVSGVGGRTGVAMVELYDLDSLSPFSSQKLMNVATRGVVGSGVGQLIAGFVVTGNTAKKVLVRGIGPALGAAPFGVPGVLADPILRLVRSDNVVVRENDNWETGNDAAMVADAALRVGAFALTSGSRDAVILINLPPGIYTAQLTGSGTSTGVGLIEVYEVP